MSVTLFQCQQRHNEWVRQKYSAGQKRETLDQLTDFLKQHSWREETDGREIREKTEADKQVRGAQSFWPCSSDNSWELLDEFSSLRFSFKIISTFVTIPLRKLVHLKNCCFQLTKNSFGLKDLLLANQHSVIYVRRTGPWTSPQETCQIERKYTRVC